jgi:predicted TIM-barrel fold metal-dependent hydrolase
MNRYLIVSADGHAGLQPEGYRDYLEAKYHPAFDEAFAAQLKAIEAAEEHFMVKDFNKNWRDNIDEGLSGAWDSAARLKVIDGDGIAAEVLFPDGITERNTPPFGAGLALKPWGVDPELQWAGARAHNRWMAEFCQEEKVRRIGLAVIPVLWSVEEAVKEIKWAHKNGLKGILIPALMGDHDGYNHPKYYPVWQTCQELDMVIHTHSGPAPDYDFALPGAMGVFLCEFAWWASRPLWYLIFGGVFEMFPRLKFVITEVSEFWVPHTLELMDVRASVKHTSGKLGDFRSNLTMKPSEYFARNCWISASAHFDEGSAAVRHGIGIDKVMWGTDYPHPEGSWPKTQEKMEKYLSGIPEDELTKMLSGNAIECYNLDVEALNKIAARIGPEKSRFVLPAA